MIERTMRQIKDWRFTVKASIKHFIRSR